MPLAKLENISKTSWWALWNITESFEELVANTEKADLELFYREKISHPQKQKEWLTSRLILKALSRQLGRSYSGTYKDSHGKPHLINQEMYVSITNSYPFAAGIIGLNHAVGIDLEYPKEKLVKVAYKFLKESELSDAKGDINRLCLYWCAKETLYKIHGKNKISLKDNLYIYPFKVELSGTIQGTITTEKQIFNYDICYMFIDSFVISFNTLNY